MFVRTRIPFIAAALLRNAFKSSVSPRDIFSTDMRMTSARARASACCWKAGVSDFGGGGFDAGIYDVMIECLIKYWAYPLGGG